MPAETIHCRAATENDIPAVMAVQSEHYSGYFLEPAETVRSRLLASPDTTWVALDEAGICAYLFGYRTVLGKVTPLRGIFEIAGNPDALYLHDLAVAKRAEGRGAGTRLVKLAWELARREGLPYSTLISLAPARAFWERLGYREHALHDAGHQARLKAYAEPVFHMAIAIDP